MNCTEFNNNLTDGTDQELAAAEQAIFDAHRAACSACQALYTSEIRMLEMLRAMPVVEPPAGFADRVLANTFKHASAQSAQNTQSGSQHKNHHRQGFMVGFGSAAAAALALWVVVGMSPSELAGTASAPEQTVASRDAKQPVLAIALNAQQTIKLAFASSESLKGAKITIRLPENVALVGYPGRRQLSWATNLKKGDNLLKLPVIATQVASGELIADIEYKGQVKTLRLNLETNAVGTSSNHIEFKQSIG